MVKSSMLLHNSCTEAALAFNTLVIIIFLIPIKKIRVALMGLWYISAHLSVA